MLHRVNQLHDFHLQCLDETEGSKGARTETTGSETGIGRVKEFYFDDRYWTIRYLVIDTGEWLAGRQVLISPHAIESVDAKERSVSVGLTKKQIEESPGLESEQPVSRQYEETYHGYYEWPMYWSGSFMWGAFPVPMMGREDWRPRLPGESGENHAGEVAGDVGGSEDMGEERSETGEAKWDPDLRSTDIVTGFYLQAADGEIGHVEDFIVDDENWAVRYLVIDTRNWWPGKRILLSPHWIERVSWNEAKVIVSLSRQAIRDAPEYSGSITREYEEELHRYYEREGYWVEQHTTTER